MSRTADRSPEKAKADYRRRDGQPLRLTATERRERARNDGRASQFVCAYVRRIVEGAPKLTPQDIEQLRAIIAPTEAEVYQAGVKAGVRMAAQHMTRPAEEGATRRLSP